MTEPISTAAGLLSAFKTAYKLFRGKLEDEKLKKAARSALKQFKFFYEDISWRHINNPDCFRQKLYNMALELRTIAIQVMIWKKNK